MRIQIACVPLVLGLTLSACATGGPNRYEAELQQLTDDCRARGGVLAPTGSVSGQPQLDNVCKITGQPSSRVGG